MASISDTSQAPAAQERTPERSRDLSPIYDSRRVIIYRKTHCFVQSKSAAFICYTNRRFTAINRWCPNLNVCQKARNALSSHILNRVENVHPQERSSAVLPHPVGRARRDKAMRFPALCPQACTRFPYSQSSKAITSSKLQTYDLKRTRMPEKRFWLRFRYPERHPWACAL
jgi:hypothetical protein